MNRWYVLEWVGLQRESRKTGSQGREDFLAFDAGEVGAEAEMDPVPEG